MRFLLGSGMYSMTDFMPMYSRLLLTVCGGTGVSAILGDGVRLGITTVGMVLDIGMVGIRRIITIITTIIIRTLHGGE